MPQGVERQAWDLRTELWLSPTWASALLIPLVGFLPASDERVRSTVDAIGHHLMRDGLVLRYDARRTRDGLRGREGAFLACSFWYADNLVLLGRRREARKLFERLLSLRNDWRMVGNFPQAFSLRMAFWSA